MIVDKATGNVLAPSGTGTHAVIRHQAPAAASNGDWIEPASKDQLWRIVPAHITAGTTADRKNLRQLNPGEAVDETLLGGLADGAADRDIPFVPDTAKTI